MQNYLKIWGCVGGVASVPLRDNVECIHGGNTPCVEVRHEGVSYIFDAGSGIVPCVRQAEKIGALFFSHFHLDPLQGLWVSNIILQPEKWGKVTFVSGRAEGYELEYALSNFMVRPLVPAALEWERYKLNYKPLLCNIGNGMVFDIHGSSARFINVIHGHTQSYSIRFTLPNRGKTIVYATDVDAGASCEPLANLALDADVLIIDTQYTDERYDSLPSPRPHSCPRVVAEVARRANVKTVITFHHGDSATVKKVKEICDDVARLLPAGVTVASAYDGMIIPL